MSPVDDFTHPGVAHPLAGGAMSDILGWYGGYLAHLIKRHEYVDPHIQVADAAALRSRTTTTLGRLGGSAATQVAAPLQQIVARAAAVEVAAGFYLWPPAFTRTKAAVARDLADQAGDPAAAAFAVGVKSVVWRYGGKPGVAVTWAQQAVDMLPAGHPARISLTCHVIRAMADMPQPDRTQILHMASDCLQAALNLPAGLRADPGIDIDRASPVETDYGLGIALLRAGMPEQAWPHIGAAQTAVDRLGDTGKQATIRLEQALWALGEPADVDRSCQLVQQAVALSPPSWGPSPVSAVGLRLSQWQRAAAVYGDVPGVADTVEQVHEWKAAA